MACTLPKGATATSRELCRIAGTLRRLGSIPADRARFRRLETPPKESTTALSRTFVDNAEAVAVRVGEDHEIRILWIQVPVNALSAEGNQPFHLGSLVIRIEVQMRTWMLLYGRFTQHQRELGARAGGRNEDHPGVIARLPWNKAQGGVPERGGAGDVIDAENGAADGQHVPSLVCGSPRLPCRCRTPVSP